MQLAGKTGAVFLFLAEVVAILAICLHEYTHNRSLWAISNYSGGRILEETLLSKSVAYVFFDYRTLEACQ